jgi:hypothetical protein
MGRFGLIPDVVLLCAKTSTFENGVDTEAVPKVWVEMLQAALYIAGLTYLRYSRHIAVQIHT